MSEKLNSEISVIGIDIGEEPFHLVGRIRAAGSCCGRSSRGQVEAAACQPAAVLDQRGGCVGARHLSRKLKAVKADVSRLVK